ncbi:MAG: DUF3089 domain-containing protein [Steroidobacteraceae bacterium]
MRRIGGLLALAVLTGCAAGEDPLVLQRHARAPADPVADVDWYEPTEAVGTQEGTPLVVAGAGDRTIDANVLDGAERYAASMNSYGLVVAHRGVIQLESYKDGFNAGRRLDSQSLHKPLVAILTMAAVADGKLALDDPLAKFIPQWRDDARGKITVRDVLYMQTGLEEPAFAARLDNRAYRMFITSDLASAVLSLGAEDAPGTRFRVHYAATQLLQMVLESATGQRYAAYLQNRLWSRIGASPARVRLDRPDGDAQVFCCLQATPRDWLRIGLMLMHHGEVGADAVIPLDAWLQLLTPSPLNANFAMQQIWRGSPYASLRYLDSREPRRGLPVSAPFVAEDVFFLEGRGGQRVYVVPSHELVVVRQGEVRMDWDDAAFLNPLIAAAPPATTATTTGRPIPTPAYSALLLPPRPDYQKDSSWARQAKTSLRPTAAFYVHPTTYREFAYWNAPIGDPAIDRGVDEVVAGQASVLDDCCDVFAPRYRQAAISALGVNRQPYELALLDVRAAFKHFLERIGDRPFVLLGHSQGALHVQRLMTDVVDRDPALSRRLVAAYIVGIPVPQAMYTQQLSRTRPCNAPDQTGCIATWSTYSANFGQFPQVRNVVRQMFAPLMQAAGTQAMQCINPLTWSIDEPSAGRQANRGAAMIDMTTLALMPPVARLVGARCDDGLLIIEPDPAPPFTGFDLMGGNYHLADIALFHRNIADNIALRAEAWQRQKEASRAR